jgi:hypothetical protein
MNRKRGRDEGNEDEPDSKFLRSVNEKKRPRDDESDLIEQMNNLDLSRQQNKKTMQDIPQPSLPVLRAKREDYYEKLGFERPRPIGGKTKRRRRVSKMKSNKKKTSSNKSKKNKKNKKSLKNRVKRQYGGGLTTSLDTPLTEKKDDYNKFVSLGLKEN